MPITKTNKPDTNDLSTVECLNCLLVLLEKCNWTMNIYLSFLEDPVDEFSFFGCLFLCLCHTNKNALSCKSAFNRPRFQPAYWLQKQRNVRIHPDMPPFDLSNTQVYSPCRQCQTLNQILRNTHMHAHKRSVFSKCTKSHWSYACNEERPCARSQPQPWIKKWKKETVNFTGYSSVVPEMLNGRWRCRKSDIIWKGSTV